MKETGNVTLSHDIPSQPHLHPYQILSKSLKGYRNYGAQKILPKNTYEGKAQASITQKVKVHKLSFLPLGPYPQTYLILFKYF